MKAHKNTIALKIIFTFMAFSLGFAEFVLIGIVPDVAIGLGEPITRIGDIVGFYALACAIATPLLALLGARLGQRMLAIGLLIIFNLGNALVFAADTYTILLTSRMMAACTSGTLLAIILALAPDVVGRNKANGLIALVLAGFSVSSVIGVPIGTLLANAFMWKAAYIAVFICGLLSSILFAATLPNSTPAGKSNATSIFAQLRLLLDGRILLNTAMIICTAAGTYVFYTYLTPVLEGVMGLDATITSGVLLLVGAGCIGSNLLSGRIANTGGLHKLPGVFIAQMIILAFLSFTPSWGVLTGITNILLLGLVMYAMNSSVQMIYQDIARSDYPSSVTFSASLHPMSFNAGIALGSFIGGAVVNVGGYAATGLVGAGVAGCALGLCLTLRHLRCAHETRTASLT